MDAPPLVESNAIAVESWLLRPLIEKLKKTIKVNEKILSKILLINDPQEINEMSQRFRQSIQEPHSIIKKIDNIFDFYINYKDKYDYNLWLKFILNRFSTELSMTFEDLKVAFDILEHENAKDSYDYTPFFKINEVLNDLNKRRVTTTAISWCQENHLYLKKNSSIIEFSLQMRDILNNILSNRTIEGLNFLKSKLFSSDQDYSVESTTKIKSSLLIFAIKSGYPFNRSRELFDENVIWNELSIQFKEEAFKCMSVEKNPLLLSIIQAGILLFNSHSCTFQKNIECPSCNPPLKRISLQLPFLHKENSFLRCPISEDIMDANNPPMALPTGTVYSLKSCQKLASLDKLICNRTGQKFSMEQLKKCYIV